MNANCNWNATIFQAFKKQHHNEVNSGLFDQSLVAQFNEEDIPTYCFSLQQQLLDSYSENSEALANLAFCHLQAGYPTLASDSVNIGLKITVRLRNFQTL